MFRFISFFWTILVICPVYFLFCVMNSVFFFVNCFNYKNFEKVEYHIDEKHKEYKDNFVFDFTSKFFTIILCTFQEFWKMLKDLKQVQL